MKTDAPKALLTRAVSFQTRADDDAGDGFTLEGIAAVFNTPTRIDSWEGEFDEQIAPGAFKKTLQERTPVVQFDHGHDIATGSVPIAAIEDIGERESGLWVRARMFDNPRVEPIRQAIAGGAIDGMSFRFRVVKEEWDESDDLDTPLRTVREVELFELGPVVFPAYDATSVGVRSLLAELTPDEQAKLISDLRGGAAPDGTPLTPSKPAPPATSGSDGVDPRAAKSIAAGLRRRPRKAARHG